MTESAKKIKNLASKAKEHALFKRDFKIPHWSLYVGAAIVIIALVFGGIQQARIWRWQKIMKSAKNKILELDTDKNMTKLKTIRDLTKKAVAPDKKKIKDINKKIRKLEEREKKIKESIDRMTPEDLLKAFKEEGF